MNNYPTVGGDFTNRRKNNEFPAGVLDSNPTQTHHVPVETTDSTYGIDGHGNDVSVMNAKNDERTTSFFAQPGILAGECLKI